MFFITFQRFGDLYSNNGVNYITNKIYEMGYFETPLYQIENPNQPMGFPSLESAERFISFYSHHNKIEKLREGYYRSDKAIFKITKKP